MQLAAQMRGGYYPAPPEAIKYAVTFLRPPAREPFTLLDPCAGEGAAVRQLGGLLSCPQERTYAIELDDGRADKVRATLPDAHVLAPASFVGCRASLNSFSFIWLNPPFDDDFGGHRVEDQFLRRATEWLMPGGVLALVCPEEVISEYSDTRRHFATYFERCKIVPFPAQHRPFKEVVVFGHKRSRIEADASGSVCWASVQAPEHFVYLLPASNGPRIFEKIEPTEPELRCLLAHSPLRAHLTAPSPGALVLRRGQVGRIPTLVPARRLDGACIFLTKAGRCAIHAVAPFGCAFFDAHMPQAEADWRSKRGLQDILEAWSVSGPYAQVWVLLASAGLVAMAPEVARKRLQRDLEETDRS